MVWVGRYQPPHTGHRELLRLSLARWAIPHVIGVVWGHRASTGGWASRNPKHFGAYYEFTAWERIKMLNLIVEGLDATDRVTLLQIPRFDLWDDTGINELLPPRQIRGTTDKDAADREQVDFWSKRGVACEILPAPAGLLTGEQLRSGIRSGVDWRAFIPEECHVYFVAIGGPERLERQAVRIPSDS